MQIIKDFKEERKVEFNKTKENVLKAQNIEVVGLNH